MTMKYKNNLLYFILLFVSLGLFILLSWQFYCFFMHKAEYRNIALANKKLKIINVQEEILLQNKQFQELLDGKAQQSSQDVLTKQQINEYLNLLYDENLEDEHSNFEDLSDKDFVIDDIEDNKDSDKSEITKNVDKILIDDNAYSKLLQEVEKKDKASLNHKDAGISILIIGLGLNKQILKQLENFPPQVKLAFTAYTDKAIFHEFPYLLKHPIYIETLIVEKDKLNNGEFTIRENYQPELVKDITYNLLNKFDNAKGVYFSNVEQLLKTPQILTILDIAKLKDKELLFNKLPSENLLNYLEEKNIAFHSANIVIDQMVDKEYILGQLNNLKNIAREQKNASAIIFAYPAMIEILEKWLDEISAEHISLIE